MRRFDEKSSPRALVPVSSSSSTRHPQHSDGDDVHGQLEELEQTDDGAADPQAQDAADVRREVDGLRTRKHRKRADFRNIFWRNGGLPEVTRVVGVSGVSGVTELSGVTGVIGMTEVLGITGMSGVAGVIGVA